MDQLIYYLSQLKTFRDSLGIFKDLLLRGCERHPNRRGTWTGLGSVSAESDVSHTPSPLQDCLHPELRSSGWWTSVYLLLCLIHALSVSSLHLCTVLHLYKKGFYNFPVTNGHVAFLCAEKTAAEKQILIFYLSVFSVWTQGHYHKVLRQAGSGLAG